MDKVAAGSRRRQGGNQKRIMSRFRRNGQVQEPDLADLEQKRDMSRFSLVPLQECHPSPENDELYRPIDPGDPALLGLAESIRQHGVREPLVLTLDGWILSGHRRHAAARLAGLAEVPVRYENIRRQEDRDGFVKLLREYNRQREKTREERLREEVVSVNPADAHRELVRYRLQRADVSAVEMEIGTGRPRRKLTDAKQPFLDAIQAVLTERRQFWPLSDRQIHYALLNNPPLKHARKPDSRYDNTPQSYKALVDVLTRARLSGAIPWAAIADETRPIETWSVWRESGEFIGKELDGLFRGYFRDLMQSQPNQLEIVAEKNTVRPIIEPVAGEFCIPMTTGRGYCSLPPRHAMAQRFRRSGKSKLILLFLSDFDPDGEEIAHSFARSMRDDFDIRDIVPIKVALTGEQVRQYGLPPVMTAKASSANYQKFTAAHGANVFELEALPPGELQSVLREAVKGVIDLEAFNAELEREHADAAFLAGARRVACAALGAIDLAGGAT